MTAGRSVAPHERLDRIDALRGVAIVWMAGFHFAFDLNHLGFVTPRQSFTSDPLWTTQRTVIVSLFLLCAGLAQAVAMHRQQGWPRFWRRWAQIAGCAALVSLGSALMFPRSWIFFGVLHGIAVMLVLARLAAPLGRWLWPLALLALLLPHLAAHRFFDAPAWRWLGLVTRKPVTEDYVPVLPWLGVVLAGLATGQALLARGGSLLRGTIPRGAAPLALLGRWSLTFYMLHQPLFIGALLLVKSIL